MRQRSHPAGIRSPLPSADPALVPLGVDRLRVDEPSPRTGAAP